METLKDLLYHQPIVLAVILMLFAFGCIFEYTRRQIGAERRPSEIPEPPHGDVPLVPKLCEARFFALRCGLLVGHEGSHHDVVENFDFLTKDELEAADAGRLS